MVTTHTHEAKDLLQSAVQREPENPVALNNLADVLMRLGMLEEAERIALKAVAAGGDSQDTAQETLAEIRAQETSTPH